MFKLIELLTIKLDCPSFRYPQLDNVLFTVICHHKVLQLIKGDEI